MADYYVDGAVGDNANAGTSEGAGNAWATIDYAVDTAAAGDHIHIKASATYTETVSMSQAGGTSAQMILEGYTSTPGDGGKATIDGEGTRANCLTGGSYSYYLIKNLIFENATSHGAYVASGDYWVWYNCEFNDNGGDGIECDDGNVFIYCSADGNTATGFDTDNFGIFLNCKATNNGGHGFQAYYCTLINCIGASNASSNAYMYTSHIPCIAYNCTFDGDSKTSNSGVLNTSNGIIVAANCIFYDCTDGIYGGGQNHPWNNWALNCLFNSNTNESSSWDTTHTLNKVTGAPAFTDEASGDYTLGSSSPARNAGCDNSGGSSPGQDIGAHQSEDAGGGSTKIVLTG